eukprot:CAMPEP_0183401320 /NCGR_PEP_ID=MMETSP0370-20130417/13176_1 /TAXON_ID=268820 /ORGANISM="Peridinium aciculiferum, Strain PAER-2" /LENGTH=751 /DNA_ID=CAMNT_0025582755 /DNA_START=72 /DNA_END=2327 /DNA_ORIENTATION=+
MVCMARALAVFAGVALAGVSAADPRPNRSEFEASKAEEAAAKEAVAAKEKKMAAVNKAVELMESLQQKVLAEAEAEAKTYEKFACFCKDTTVDRLEQIQKGEDEKASLSADISELSSNRDGLDALIKETIDNIAKAEKEMKEASEERAKTLKLYESNSADLQSALDSLDGAIKTLKSSASPSLVQISDSLRTALNLADALNLGGSAKDRKVIALLQEPSNNNEVPIEDYDFHSNGIIGTLEKLNKDFRNEKLEVDQAEVKSVKAFEIFMQEKTDYVKDQNHKLDKAKEEKEQTIAEIQSAIQQLSTVESELLSDKEYTNELSKMCQNKAKTWDQRTKVRSNELATLTQAIAIIKGAVSEKSKASTLRLSQQTASVRQAEAVATNADDMEAIEIAAEEQEAPSFLQGVATLASVRRLRGGPAGNDDGRAMIANLLRNDGDKLKSTLLLALASKIAADPFAKIKTLIQELIERLLQEANNEANQKGWCDKATADAEQKRDYAAEEVRELNAEMAKLEAIRDTLTEDLFELEKGMKEIKEAQASAQQERDTEAAQNKETTEEAEVGLKALNMCIDLMDKFYKTVAKESIDLSLAQGPADDAPDAGFDNGEAYTGAQSESGGIMAMLSVMQSDFERTIEETRKAEEQAQKDHLDFMTESGMSLASKEASTAAKKEQLEDTTSNLGEAEQSLFSQTGILKTSLKELLDLKPVCIDTGMSYEERIAHREDEIQSLNKAMCILEKYAEFGPEGAAEGC